MDKARADEAKAGQMVDETTLPDAIRRAGGGWAYGRYFVTGAHKDGTAGWKCLEVGGEMSR